jgi:hypothetical protein
LEFLKRGGGYVADQEGVGRVETFAKVEGHGISHYTKTCGSSVSEEMTRYLAWKKHTNEGHSLAW